MKVAARLLLLVALLLPFRGALAASGMLCHAADASPLAVIEGRGAQVHDHPAGATGHRHHGDGSGSVSDDHTLHAVNAGASGNAGPAAGASTCDLCSSVCASPPLLRDAAQLPALPPATGERFPAIVAPRLAPTLGGLERPPRSV